MLRGLCPFCHLSVRFRRFSIFWSLRSYFISQDRIRFELAINISGCACVLMLPIFSFFCSCSTDEASSKSLLRTLLKRFRACDLAAQDSSKPHIVGYIAEMDSLHVFLFYQCIELRLFYLHYLHLYVTVVKGSEGRSAGRQRGTKKRLSRFLHWSFD